MALARYRYRMWEPWRQTERLMDQFMGWRARPTEVAPEAWAPSVEIHQTDHELVVAAELPGIQKDAVEIESTAESLTIRGERKAPEGMKCPEHGVSCTEFCYGPFGRTVPWPMQVKAGEAKASMHDGILEVHVPIAESAKAAQPVRVQVQ